MADFIGELVAGSSYTKFFSYGNTHEKALWLEFKKDLCYGKIENWLYNSTTIKDRPADLRYYIGYRIAKAYYKKQKNKRRVIADVIGFTKSEDFLANSGYDPQ